MTQTFFRMIIVTTPLITMKRLLMAYDGSEASEKALEMTLKCAAKEDEIIILTVIPGELVDSSFTNMLLPTIDLSSIIQSGSFKEKAMQNLQKVANRIESHVAKTEVVVESGDAADEILLASKKYEIDIIIVGYKGYGKEGRFLLGSVADKVVRHASRSVLVVR